MVHRREKKKRDRDRKREKQRQAEAGLVAGRADQLPSSSSSASLSSSTITATAAAAAAAMETGAAAGRRDGHQLRRRGGAAGGGCGGWGADRMATACEPEPWSANRGMAAESAGASGDTGAGARPAEGGIGSGSSGGGGGIALRDGALPDEGASLSFENLLSQMKAEATREMSIFEHTSRHRAVGSDYLQPDE
jgi:hypothetical protein|eukprot:COSAG02_NODE_10365_length_1958_cov_1.954814_1_plen_193_part_00